MNPHPQIAQNDSRAALEDIAHLSRKICATWGSPELDSFLSKLIMDGRDGARQGLPVALAAEILFLAETNKMLRAIELSKKLGLHVEETYRMVDQGDQKRLKFDALDDPLISRDTITRKSSPTATPERRSAAPVAGDQLQGLLELLLMLMRSKWLIWAIIVVLSLKFLWPIVKPLIYSIYISLMK